MSHHCEALILHCIDFRFGKAIKKFLEENHLLDDCDIVSLAGSAKNLATPIAPSYTEMVLKQIEISKRLHQISQVILMNHTDCGAYGGREAFENPEAEYNQHANDMKKAQELIVKKFPDLSVRKVLAKIAPLGQISFEEIE